MFPTAGNTAVTPTLAAVSFCINGRQIKQIYVRNVDTISVQQFSGQPVLLTLSFPQTSNYFHAKLQHNNK
jgi:hypothetical protein